ncbi:MAG: ATP-binding protein [Bacteroidia bacterium]|nr:ATP-binding protein [Bacteroidia bacterium]
MLFKRESYLQKLKEAQGNGMIKIITGIRRCGKSFLLFDIFYRYLRERGVPDKQIIRIDLEDRRNQNLRNPDNLLQYIDSNIIGDQHHFVFIDEIQLVPEFEDVLNSYLKMSNVDVYVTGSNSKFLSTDVITEFRGRGWEIRVRPLSFAEYYEERGGDKHEALIAYYLYGGLPGAVVLESDEQKQNYLRNVYETAYLRDVIDRNHLQNKEGLREMVRILASDIGTSTNIRRLVNTFKSEANMAISPNTIQSYLSYLQDAFVISEALRFNVKGRKYIGTETKYYFEDTGIRNAAIGFRQVEYNHVMENVVYNELRLRHFNVDVGQVDVFERDKEGKLLRKNLEIDFVVNRGSERIYLQSAYRIPDHEKWLQEQRPLINVKDAFKKVIIEDEYRLPHYNEQGVYVTGLFDFLLNPNSLNM